MRLYRGSHQHLSQRVPVRVHGDACSEHRSGAWSAETHPWADGFCADLEDNLRRGHIRVRCLAHGGEGIKSARGDSFCEQMPFGLSSAGPWLVGWGEKICCPISTRPAFSRDSNARIAPHRTHPL